MSNDSEITYHEGGGASYVGPDATLLFRAKVIKGGIQMWQKCKMIPTRGVTISKLLKMASELTGNKYKNTDADYTRAMEELDNWILTMQTAIPTTNNRPGETPPPLKIVFEK
jgi:hypothetical protein